MKAKGPKAPKAPKKTRPGQKEHWLNQLATFNEIGKALTSSLDLKEILNIVMEKVSELLSPRNWSLLLLDDETRELKFEIVVGEGAEKIKDLRLRLGEGIAGWVAREMEPILVEDVSKDPRFSNKADQLSDFTTRSIICVPLVARGECLGVIELVNKVDEKASFVEEDLLVLRTVADYTAIAIENAQYFNKVQELTIKDDLTGLYNARFLQGRLDYEVERARRFGYDLSMIFLDLDHFKEVNDRYGHIQGSKLLAEAAELLKGMTRTVDVLCRYGGDEFIVIMPETSKKGAVKLAEKLRMALKKEVFLKDEGINARLTGSFGVASFPEDASSRNDLVQMADKAMYRVKNSDRDGVAEF